MVIITKTEYLVDADAMSLPEYYLLPDEDHPWATIDPVDLMYELPDSEENQYFNLDTGDVSINGEYIPAIKIEMYFYGSPPKYWTTSNCYTGVQLKRLNESFFIYV